MELKDLVGIHDLSGVDTTVEKVKIWSSYENVEVVRFVLDGITYKAIENPDDGYRSLCKELLVCNEAVSNKFPPQKVRGSVKGNTSGNMHDVIQFYDLISHKLVLEVGTNYVDDYYPCWVMGWYPQNLACNIGR